MVEVREGGHDGRGLKLGVVASRFNSAVTERLLSGALDALERHGVAEDAIRVVRVPGAFEIPLVADWMAASGEWDAIVCLGALIKGETPHFDFISAWVVAEIGRSSLAHRVPIALGILTTNTTEQALERSGTTHGNKGFEAALVAIEMANLLRRGHA
jgi:6,7-dimethyl-8-ribityllumazine synthase